MKTKIVINAPVVTGFLLLSFLATLSGQVSDQETTELFFSTFGCSLLNPLTYPRLFTHALGHFSWERYLGNALLILLTGPALEEKAGSKALFIGMILSAGVTGLTSCLLFPETGIFGASEIVFCLVILSALSGFRSGEIPLTFLLILAVLSASQILEVINPSQAQAKLCFCAGALCGILLLAKKV